MNYRFFILIAITFFSFNVFGQPFKVGDQAPEIVQNLVTGEEFKLSELKGQMVLIDFWSSWCKPCRKENPNIVAAYHKYKDKSFKNGEGFTVLSVSLDFKKELWEAAIVKDQLEWPYHVSDLKMWKNEAAVAYGVKSIPTSYLIDGTGKIVGVNLKGDSLDKKLRKLVKKK